MRSKAKQVSSANTSFQSRFLVKKKEGSGPKDNLASLVKSRRALNSSLPEPSLGTPKLGLPGKSKRQQKLEKLARELRRNGIKLDVANCESLDEDLVKHLMSIQRLISLKKKTFGGEALEILQVGKEIILQVGEPAPGSPPADGSADQKTCAETAPANRGSPRRTFTLLRTSRKRTLPRRWAKGGTCSEKERKTRKRGPGRRFQAKE